MVMNAGAYGGEMAQVVECVRVMDENGEILELGGEDMEFGYRTSVIKNRPFTVLEAVLVLENGEKACILQKMDELSRQRREKQPLEYPSAGSAFKRPAGQFAGRLIEECGLKGCRVGGAQVSEKHAGFIINRGGATCADVLALIRLVQERVQAQTGVLLEPEIRVLK